MKKVFDIKTFIEDMYNSHLWWLAFYALTLGWPYQAQGKTKEECNKEGIYILRDWMKEVY